MISHNSISTFHFLDEHLSEIDASEIVILENLGTQLNRKVNVARQSVFHRHASFAVFSQRIGRGEITGDPSREREGRRAERVGRATNFHRVDFSSRRRFFTLAKLIHHPTIVACLGFVNVSPERCFLVNEHSRTNLLDFCRTLTNEDENLLTSEKTTCPTQKPRFRLEI